MALKRVNRVDSHMIGKRNDGNGIMKGHFYRLSADRHAGGDNAFVTALAVRWRGCDAPRRLRCGLSPATSTVSGAPDAADIGWRDFFHDPLLRDDRRVTQ